MGGAALLLFGLISSARADLSATLVNPALIIPALQEISRTHNESKPCATLSALEHTEAPHLYSDHPLRLFTLTPTASTRRHPERSLQASFSATNTWGPGLALIGCDGPQCGNAYTELAANPDSVRFVRTDGVIEDFKIKYTEPVGKFGELTATVRVFRLSGCGFLDKPVCDKFIEWAHPNLFGYDDPFGRLKRPMEQAGIRYVDPKGRTYEVKNGDIQLGNVDVGYTRFIQLLDNKKNVLSTMTVSLNGSVPLNSQIRNVALGGAAELTTTVGVGKGVSITGAAGGGVAHQSVLSLKKDQVDFTDENKITTNYHFMMAVNKDWAKKRGTFGIELNGQSALLKRERYTWLPAVNVDSVRFPDTSTRGTWGTAKSSTEPSENMVFFLAVEGKESGHRLLVYGAEDISLFGSGPKFMKGGPNANDWTMGAEAKLRFKLPQL